MTYQVRYTENNNSNKKAIIVDDKTINNQTSLNLVGSNYPNYASFIGGDLLHIMENFANPTPPINPVQGQLWYDNINNQLMVNSDATETGWISSGSVIKSGLKPQSARSGDLWVDNVRQQLYLFTGVSWILVGPEYNQDTLTGQIIETIYDSSDYLRGIISIYSENNRIAIISSYTFTPKLAIPGFSTINAGITLVNSDDQQLPGQTLSTHRFYGTSTNSERLGGELASKYILSNAPLVSLVGSLKASNLSLGGDRNFYLGDSTETSSYVISTTASTTKSFEIQMNAKVIASFLPNGRVGISTKTPTTELDVNGTTTSNKLIVDGTEDVSYFGLQTASSQLKGGLYVEKSVLIGSSGNLTITSGTITVSNNSSNVVFQPSATKAYDIGTSDKVFRNIYSQTFYGNVEGNLLGNVSGNVSGDVSGKAGSLKTTATFEFLGDISSNNISFNGTQTSVSFNTSLNSLAFSSKPELSILPNTSIIPSAFTDQLLVYRSQGEVTAIFTGYITDTTLHIVSVTSGTITIGSVITGTGVLTNTKILSGSGSLWTVNTSQTTGSLQAPVSIHATSKIFRTTKQTLLSNVPTVKPGTIILYPNEVPEGYLKCDGTIYYQSHYPDLFYALGAESALYVDQGKFTVPNIPAPSSGNMIVLNYIIFTGIL